MKLSAQRYPVKKTNITFLKPQIKRQIMHTSLNSVFWVQVFETFEIATNFSVLYSVMVNHETRGSFTRCIVECKQYGFKWLSLPVSFCTYLNTYLILRLCSLVQTSLHKIILSELFLICCSFTVSWCYDFMFFNVYCDNGSWSCVYSYEFKVSAITNTLLWCQPKGAPVVTKQQIIV